MLVVLIEPNPAKDHSCHFPLLVLGPECRPIYMPLQCVHTVTFRSDVLANTAGISKACLIPSLKHGQVKTVWPVCNVSCMNHSQKLARANSEDCFARIQHRRL